MDEKMWRYGCLFCRTGAEAAIAGYINQTITDVEAVVRLSTVFLAKRLTDFVIIRSILPSRASATICLNCSRFLVLVPVMPSSI